MRHRTAFDDHASLRRFGIGVAAPVGGARPHADRSVGPGRKNHMERGGRSRVQGDAVAALEPYGRASALVRYEQGPRGVTAEIDTPAAGDDRAAGRHFDRADFILRTAQQPDVEIAAGVLEGIVRAVGRYGDRNVGVGPERTLPVGLYGRQGDGQGKVGPQPVARHHRIVGVERLARKRDVTLHGEKALRGIRFGKRPVGQVGVGVVGRHDAYHVALRPRHTAVFVERRAAHGSVVHLLRNGPYRPFARFRLPSPRRSLLGTRPQQERGRQCNG